MHFKELENEREERKQRQKMLEEEAKRQEKIRKKQKEKEVLFGMLIRLVIIVYLSCELVN